MKRAISVLVMISLILLSGCTEAGVPTFVQTTGTSTVSQNNSGSEPLSIAYICRDLQHPWYKRISETMEAQCRAWGIDYRSVDCHNRDDLFVKYIDAYILNKTDVIIVSPTNEGIGPIVTTKCADAKIPLLSIDTRLKYPDGRNASYIGKSSYDCGVAGALEMVSQGKGRNFFEGSLQVIQLTISSFYHVNQMVSGFDKTLKLESPVDLNGNTIVVETVDDSFSAQYMTLTRKLTELDQNRKYMVFAYNDDGALAFYRFAVESGIDFRNLLICSVGGYEPSFSIFAKADFRSASFFAISISAADIGLKAIEIVRDASVRETALPEWTTIPETIIRVYDYQYHPDSQVLGSTNNLSHAEMFYTWKIT